MKSTVTKSRRFEKGFYVTFFSLVLLRGISSFNLDSTRENYIFPRPDQEREDPGRFFFGYSLTIDAYEKKWNGSSDTLLRFIIGAPVRKPELNSKDEELTTGTMYECLFSSSSLTDGLDNTGRNVCSSVHPFIESFNAKRPHRSKDGLGMSSHSARRKKEKAGTYKTEEWRRKFPDFPTWSDVFGRPLHHTQCGSSSKLEGGAIVSGVVDLHTNTSTHDILDISRYFEELNGEHLKATWRILNPCHEDCVTFSLIDLIFLIDGSASIKQRNFAVMLSWIKNVSDAFDITSAVRIGVVQYSYWNPRKPLNKQRFIKTEISLGQYTNKSEFDKAVDKIKYQRASTYTAHAINKTVKYDFEGPSGRYPNAARVMVLLTDGQSSDKELLPESAQFAMMKGVVAYAVGIGPAYKPEELRLIAGSDERVFEVENFASLDKIVKGLQMSISESLEGGTENTTNELVHCQAGFSSFIEQV